MKLIKKIILTLFILLILLAVGGVIFVNTADFNQYKPQIASAVKENTGRDLNIYGNIEPAFGLYPTLEVFDVEFSNDAKWTKQSPHMAKIGRAEVQLALIPLLFGNVEIISIELDDADIFLAQSEEKGNNWTFKEAAQEDNNKKEKRSSEPFTPAIETVDIQNSKVLFINNGKTHNIQIENLDFSEDWTGSEITIKADYNDMPIDLTATVSPLKDIIDGKLNIKYFEMGKNPYFDKLNLAGKLDNIYESPEVNLEVDLKGRFAKPYSLSGVVKGGNEIFNINDVHFNSADSDVKGSFAVNLVEETPYIKADLISRSISMNDFVEIKEEETAERTEGEENQYQQPEKPKAKKEKVFSSEPLNFDGLKALNADFDLDLEQFLYKDFSAENISLKADIDKGVLTVSSLTADINKGQLEAKAEVNSSTNIPTVKFDGSTNQLNLGNLLEELDTTKNLKNGIINSKITLEGYGRSVAEIMGNLKGEIAFFLEEGKYTVKEKLSTFMQTFVKILMGDEVTGVIGLNCSVGKLEIAQGIAETKTFVLDTDGAFVVGSGDVNLRKEKLGLVFEPTAKTIGLADLVSAVRLGGTLASPSVYPDPLAVTKNLGKTAIGIFTGIGIVGMLGMEVAEEIGFGDDNPCAEILKKQQERKSPDGKSQEEGKSFKDKVKGIFDF